MQNDKEEVLIIGLDEQGLFLSILFAKANFHVTAFDLDKNKICFLKKGYYDKRIQGLEDVFLLYKENISFSFELSSLKNRFNYIIVNNLQQSEYEILDVLSQNVQLNCYFIMTEETSFVINHVIYDYFQKEGKSVHVINWPIIKDQKGIYLQVLYPSIHLIGCRNDEEHLAMHLLMDTLYHDSCETIYTDIQTSTRIPFFMESCSQIFQSFFKEQMIAMLNKKENIEDFFYIMQKINYRPQMRDLQKAEPQSMISKTLFQYEERIDDELIHTLYTLLYQRVRKGDGKIAFLGIPSTSHLKSTYVYLLMKKMTKVLDQLWFYDDDYLLKVKETIHHDFKVHFATQIKEALQGASVLVIGNPRYSNQHIENAFVLDLTKLQYKE